jgi:class 3 adenylate cyclase
MALVFFNSVHAAFKCAVDVGKKCYKSASIGLRNGLYTGPVVPVRDINNNPNVSGHGINMAQRCMDAGDNDHILISNGVYMNVSEMGIPGLKFEDWGPVIVKHGSTVHLHTAYGPNFGRTEFPDWRGTKKAEYK